MNSLEEKLKKRAMKSSSLVNTKKYQMNGNVYDLADYTRKGLLIDTYHELGEKGVERELKLLVPFMYCSGRGLTLKQGHLFNPLTIHTSNGEACHQEKKKSSAFSRKKVSSTSSSSATNDKHSTPFSVSSFKFYSLKFMIVSNLTSSLEVSVS